MNDGHTYGTTADAVGFKTDILPLFTQTDFQHMERRRVKLNDYAYMSNPSNDHANAQNVYEQVSTGTMPPGEAWPSERVELFAKWMADGYHP